MAYFSRTWPAGFIFRGPSATVRSKKQRRDATFLDPSADAAKDADALGQYDVKGIEFLSGSVVVATTEPMVLGALTNEPMQLLGRSVQN